MLQLSPDASVDLRTIMAAALIVGPWLFALVDAASRPLSGWWAAGHSKVL